MNHYMKIRFRAAFYLFALVLVGYSVARLSAVSNMDDDPHRLAFEHPCETSWDGCK